MTTRVIPDKGPLGSMETFESTLYSLPRAPIRMAMIEAVDGLTAKFSCSMYQLISSRTLPRLASLMDVLICNTGVGASILVNGVPANELAAVRTVAALNVASKQIVVSNRFLGIGMFLSWNRYSPCWAGPAPWHSRNSENATTVW